VAQELLAQQTHQEVLAVHLWDKMVLLEKTMQVWVQQQRQSQTGLNLVMVAEETLAVQRVTQQQVMVQVEVQVEIAVVEEPVLKASFK
jgi:hypothetical protein